jgi:hypothetical protein
MSRVVKSLLFVWLLGLGAQAFADERDDDAVSAPGGELAHEAAPHLALETGYALGVTRFELDSFTEVIGWKIADSVYFGHQDGEDSGLSIVWQKDANQVSLSKDGLRLTRRF